MPQVDGGPGEILLRDVLRRNGEEQLFYTVLELAMNTDEERPLIFEWKSVSEFTQAIALANATQDQNQASKPGAIDATVPTPPFPMPTPLTVEAFKHSLLKYASTGGAEPLGSSCLLCSNNEYRRSLMGLELLRTHPWMKHVIAVGEAAGMNVLPIANVYESKPHTQILVFATPPVASSPWRE